MNQKLSIKFWLNKQKKKANGTMPIYMKITVDSKRAFVSTNFQLKPSQWNSKTGTAIGTSPNIAKVNLIISKWKTQVEEHFINFKMRKETTSANELKSLLLNKGYLSHLFNHILK